MYTICHHVEKHAIYNAFSNSKQINYRMRTRKLKKKLVLVVYLLEDQKNRTKFEQNNKKRNNKIDLIKMFLNILQLRLFFNIQITFCFCFTCCCVTIVFLVSVSGGPVNLLTAGTVCNRIV